MKSAMITGITGQDGAYLAQLLLSKGYHVIGVQAKNRIFDPWRLEELGNKQRIGFHSIDYLDSGSIRSLLSKIRPNEFYNLAAFSFVGESFNRPLEAAQINAEGVIRILESIRSLGLDTKFYQASSSEIFGHPHESPQNEDTKCEPQNPYGIAKLYAHWMTKYYRTAFDMFTCSGILFNHESPLRGDQYVTRKITKNVAKIKAGYNTILEVGNIYAERDWGYAPKYVEGMWKMMQQNTPDDYVLATGRTTTVKKFIECAFRCVDIDIDWEGAGLQEVAVNRSNGKICVQISPEFYRPVEVANLVGDSTKASNELKWTPELSLENIINEMVKSDLKRIHDQ